MKKHEKDSVIKRYSERLQQFGDDPRTLGWTKDKHFLRYHILLSHWKFNGESLLDFGCGFGDMYAYIKEKELNINYSGVDINPNLINAGKKKYPNAGIECIDIFENDLANKYDYVVSSGVHNFKLENNWEFIVNTFQKFSEISKRGFALNFISDKVDFKEDHLYNANPGQILELAYKYSNKIVLRNDYMPFEFTVFVDMNKDYDKDLVIYPEYLAHIKK